MKKNFLLTMVLALLALFTVQTTNAQAPVATPQEAVTALLNRIGGDGAADKFEIVIDSNLAENGKDVFVITSQDGKPCIKGNTQLSVTTGINWYLNHYAHINLTWNNLTTDLSAVTLPVPTQEEKHVCNTTYRYDFNTCTFSYSMAFWTWERWQQEIDWMALHGINAPLNLVGLDVVTRKFLRELGVSENDINAYIAGPGFIAWFAMNNLEGWGGTINATDVTMNGNPDWWYTRQENLCRNMLQRMRELGMQPVIPGFSGQVPNCIVNYSINGFSSGDVVNNGTWAGGYTRPDILKPNTESYRTFAAVYYKHLHEVMGVSELYSIDPFHEGSLPSGVSNETCYPNIMVELDNYYNGVSQEDKTKNNVDEQPKWIIQYWQGVPQSGAFSAMSSYGDRFIGLDLFSDAPGKAKWNTDYFKGRPYIFCMLHNFGGRSGMHGRLESTMNDYFRALAKGNNCQGIGATPEGTETNPILYDMLFELPWMNVNDRPTADEWLEDYSYSRYGVKNAKALEALQNLKKSVWACPTDQQGTSEAVILARPNWTICSVSSWSTAAIYWDTQDVLLAADQLASISDLITTADGTANYNYDFIDVVRQAMVDYAAQLLPLINASRSNNAEYTRLYQLYLQLMLDLDEMLSYDENFKLERWTSLARNIANEVDGTTENDRRWLEWNARTQVTVWSKGDTDLHDYSNRCWAGLIKDYHYKRWEKFFTTNGGSFQGGWFSGFEYPWTVNFTDYNYSTVTIPGDMTATAKAKQTFGEYFGRVVGKEKNYIFPMGVTTDATKSDVIPEVYRGATVALPLVIGKNVTISSAWIDLNNDGAASNNETLAVTDGKVIIPADAAIGKTTAKVTYSDGTVIMFNIALIEDITDARTVTAVAGANGSVAIEGADGTSVTNALAVKMIATPNTGYNFEKWTDAQGNTVSNDNPFIYYGKEEAEFTAHFIQDKWGVVECADDRDNQGVVKDEAAVMNDISNNKQYIKNLTFAYYNRDAETIFEGETAPTAIFTTIPGIINVPQGASFTVEYDSEGDGFKHCYFRAFIDLNADGDFDDEGELLTTVGTAGAQNTAVCSSTIKVILPYNIPLGITHMRLRFDSAWNIGEGAKSRSVRPVYEVVINVTEFSDKAATINVETNSEEWGTVKVWTDETPSDITATEWDVTKGVSFNIKATPTSGDVEFLGWYDQYGRLLTENLEHSMYAREDATYTARFRKFLEIDGWQVEYRTEPGTEIVTKKLANGVKPEAGKKYYIYADTYYGGAYVNRYLYNNNGTLALNTAVGDANYMWLCSVDGENYTFQNVADPTKYLKHKGIQASPYNFKLGTGNTSHEGITIYSVSDDRYLVTKNDGSKFDQATGTYTQSSADWNTDYVFTEITTPDVVVLTNVRQNGNHDLVIPETVEILGQQLKIVGFDDGLFNNNKDLWSITLPSTMEFVGNNVWVETSMNGENTPVSNSDNSPTTITQVIDLGGVVLKNNEPWKVVAEYESDGVSSFNQWGSFLLCIGAEWGGAELLYLSTGKNGGDIWHLRSPASGLADDYFKDFCNGKMSEFTVTLINKGNGKAVITLKNDQGETKTSEEFNFTADYISAFCARIPTGLDITSFKVGRIEETNPFSGCSNLDAISINGDCAAYYVNDEGDLYNSADELVCSPEGKEKGPDSRELAALIEKMQVLTSQVATYNPTGKANKITLQTTDHTAVNYLWTNNADPDEGSIHHLVDGIKGNNNNFFHSNWHNASTTEGYHYIEVDLGADNTYSIMQFAYHTRTGCSNDFPDAITVMGSNDKTNYTEIHTENSNLPQATNQTFTSAVFDCGKAYRYLRFKVAAERTYWHMGEFELYFMGSTADVYSYLETGITNEQAATAYDAMVKATYIYNVATTAAEVQAAKTELQNAYDTLLALLQAAIPVKLTADEANPVLYKIIIKRANDETKVLKYDNTDSMVAVAAKADNNSWQAWYFMSSVNGVTIHPYNADGKVLSADNTGNSPAKVWAVEKGEKYFYEWKFVARADGYYNIQARDGSNYFSNNGGESNKMGFWSGSPESDGGSLFKFVEAEFSDDNARYYQLKDVKATMTNGTNIYGGTSVGLYTGGTEYREAYNRATELIGDGTISATSSSADCYATYKALRETIKNLAYNAPDPSKVYYIVSTASNDYCRGEYVHTNIVPTPRTCYWGTNTYNQDHLLFDAKIDIAPMSIAAFQFVETGTQGVYKMKSLHTEMAVNSFAGTHMTDGAGQNVTLAGIADGQVTLKVGNNSPMHAQNDYGVIVQWGASVSNASTWTINEVTDLSELNYTVNIPDGYTTLNLAFPVVLPAGVEAYDIVADDIVASENVSDRYEYKLTQIAVAGDVLAKNTPVIIKAATAGDYTFAITFNSENAKGAADGSVLLGNKWQTTVGTAEVNYLPAIRENKLVFNKVTADSTAVTANTVWAVLIEDKGATIYEYVEPEPELPVTYPVAGKVYRIKNFVENTPADYQFHYIVNNNVAIAFPTTVEENDNSALWICTGADDDTHKYQFVSALGTAAFGWQGVSEIAFEYTISAGTVGGTVTLGKGDTNLALTTEAWNNRGNAAFNQASYGGKAQEEHWSTDWYLEEVTGADISFTQSISKGNKWATMYLPYAVNIPTGVEVYSATGLEGKKITLSQLTNVIPARTPVLLWRQTNAATEMFSFSYAAGAAQTVEESENVLFEGCILQTAIDAADARVYLLMNYNSAEKFYWVADEYNANCQLDINGGYVKCDANKVYLKVSTSQSPAASYSFRFDGTTDIEDIEGENAVSGDIYDLQGRKVAKPVKGGIYIKNGVKVIM